MWWYFWLYPFYGYRALWCIRGSIRSALSFSKVGLFILISDVMCETDVHKSVITTTDVQFSYMIITVISTSIDCTDYVSYVVYTIYGISPLPHRIPHSFDPSLLLPFPLLTSPFFMQVDQLYTPCQGCHSDVGEQFIRRQD